MFSQLQSSANGNHGIVLLKHNKTSIAHVKATSSKSPFSSIGIPVTMYELDPGISSTARHAESASLTGPKVSFSGQYGLIDFDTSVRLPRHVHIAKHSGPLKKNLHQEGKAFVTEKILVLNGVACVELNGMIYVVPPRTLVTIAPGVPHTWTACPVGVSFSEAIRLHDSRNKSTGSDSKATVSPPEPFPTSNGSFLMVYEYETETGFFPTEQTETLQSVNDYVKCDDLEKVRFPKLTAEDIYDRGWFVWCKTVWNLGVGSEKSL